MFTDFAKLNLTKVIVVESCAVKTLAPGIKVSADPGESYRVLHMHLKLE